MNIELTDERFCEIYTALYGEEIDNINQLKKHVFTGEELKDFLERSLSIYIKETDYKTGFSEGYAEAVRDKNEEVENHLNEIGQLQEQLKEAEAEIRDLNNRE